MEVLVTGAAGRIGAHLTRALVREGHHVRGLVLAGDPRVKLIEHPHVTLIEGDLRDPAAMREATSEVDAIFHLAGALTSRGNSDDEFFELNLRGTFNLLTAAREVAPGLRRFAYASSDAVYVSGAGLAVDQLPVDERVAVQPSTVYGASKAGAEQLCLAFWRRDGFPATILRFGATCDCEELIDPRSVFSRWLFLRSALEFASSQARSTPAQAAACELLRSLDNGREQMVVLADEMGNPEIRQWGDARDVAEGCLLTLENPCADGEVFNLGGAAPFSTGDLIEYITARTGYTSVKACLPTARPAWWISSEKAKEMLGYSPSRTVFAMVDEALADGLSGAKPRGSEGPRE